MLMITKILYDTLWSVVGLPYAFIRLWVKGKKEPAYRKRWSERLAFVHPPVFTEQPVWIHAVSLGEVRAAVPIVGRWLETYPHIPIVMTTMTPTGSAEVQKTFSNAVFHCYLPYDTHHCIQRFLNRIQPQKIIILETEIWPNLFWAAKKRQIPLYIVNARISPKAFQQYIRFQSFFKLVFPSVTKIFAQSDADAKRYQDIGAIPAQIGMLGNIKFDLKLPDGVEQRGQTLRQQLGDARPVFLAASTHAGEESVLLRAFQIIWQQCPHSLLLLVPRHPNRFDTIYQQCLEYPFVTQRRSAGEPVRPETQVYVGDTMGEMMLLIAASDVVFVGGSLVPIGGHNTLEPASLAKPVLSGPQVFNFDTITEMLKANQAICIVDTAEGIAEAVLGYFQHPETARRDGQRALEVFAKNQGSLEKLFLEIA